MKSILAIALVSALVAAEVPSNSYLPPPPNRGYSQATSPSIIAARALDQGHGDHNGDHHGVSTAIGVNGFARSGPQTHDHAAHALGPQSQDNSAHAHGPQARFNGNEEQGYDHNGAGFARNSLDDFNAEPVGYHYGYMVSDHQEGTDFGHQESRSEARAHGEYHVVLPDGRRQTVSYEANERGYKPQISYEDSEDISRSSSGYDDNANNFRANNGYHGNDQDGAGSNARSNGYN